jgi:hypothetical protein
VGDSSEQESYLRTSDNKQCETAGLENTARPETRSLEARHQCDLDMEMAVAPFCAVGTDSDIEAIAMERSVNRYGSTLREEHLTWHEGRGATRGRCRGYMPCC